MPRNWFVMDGDGGAAPCRARLVGGADKAPSSAAEQTACLDVLTPQ